MEEIKKKLTLQEKRNALKELIVTTEDDEFREHVRQLYRELIILEEGSEN